MAGVDPRGDLAGTRGRAALWFGFLGGGFAWLLHFLLAWVISEFGCISGTPDFSWLGISGVAWLLIGQTAATAALALAAVYVAWRLARRYAAGPVARRAGYGAKLHLARAGVLASGIFLLILLVQSIPIFFYLGGCCRDSGLLLEHHRSTEAQVDVRPMLADASGRGAGGVCRCCAFCREHCRSAWRAR